MNNIINFKNYNYHIIKNIDETCRSIGYTQIKNSKIIGKNNFYPNILFYDSINIISPYDETVMSLKKNSFYENNYYDITENEKIDGKLVNDKVFFFIYNFDNYYHYLYDTLSYLYTYIYLKNIIPELKLLVNYPNKCKNNFYKFNIELLEMLIDIKDIIVHQENTIYNYVYISSSLTHGGYSNNYPRKEIFNIYDLIKSKVIRNNNPELVYISRRSWINNDNSNIGTDYTTRRKMINEDRLVEELTKLGFIEIFAENLTINDKISLFSNAKIIVGSIGGGMANLLFSSKNTKSIILVTPYFLEINFRFKYTIENSDFNYFYDIVTYNESNIIPLYCRVKIINNTSKYFNKIGEIIEYSNLKYKINLSENDISGFNNLINYESLYFYPEEFELIDNGLNSPYIVNIDNLIKKIKEYVD